ncbi:MAG TPA: hypothetical protein VKE40_25930, partial [Gemmataceae bacterium]|nr:hypothetical protein [Gemmataceae bacterium]
LVAIGLLAWPLMPVTIAAENSDVFDALSRAYNYAFQWPFRFVLLTVATLALSALPLVVVLFVLAGPVENWVSAAGHPAVWVAAALSASIFWSLQTLAYLQLRTAADGVDAYEIARDSESAAAPVPTPSNEGQQEGTASAEPKPAAPGSWLIHVVILGLMVATWALTAWLFARFGGENSGWLGWGLGERFRPTADGLYYLASLIAGGWGVIWLAAPVVVALRRAFRADPAPAPRTPSA